MTVQDAGAVLNLSRAAVRKLIESGALPSRVEVTERNVAQRVVQRADVERVLQERREAAARQTGKGRPIKLPKSSTAN